MKREEHSRGYIKLQGKERDWIEKVMIDVDKREGKDRNADTGEIKHSVGGMK